MLEVEEEKRSVLTDEQQVMSPEMEYSDADRKALVREGIGEEEKAVADGYSSRRHVHGC